MQTQNIYTAGNVIILLQMPLLHQSQK